jgi:hypothetical protein
MLGSTWENVGTLVTAIAGGVAYGAYQRGEWGDLAMSTGALVLGLLIAYAGFRTRYSAEVEEERLKVMLEELKAAPRRSQPSHPKAHPGPSYPG